LEQNGQLVISKAIKELVNEVLECCLRRQFTWFWNRANLSGKPAIESD